MWTASFVCLTDVVMTRNDGRVGQRAGCDKTGYESGLLFKVHSNSKGKQHSLLSVSASENPNPDSDQEPYDQTHRTDVHQKAQFAVGIHVLVLSLDLS